MSVFSYSDKGKGVIIMEKKEEKKEFIEPELIKYEEKLDEVTMNFNGSPCDVEI